MYRRTALHEAAWGGGSAPPHAVVRHGEDGRGVVGRAILRCVCVCAEDARRRLSAQETACNGAQAARHGEHGGLRAVRVADGQHIAALPVAFSERIGGREDDEVCGSRENLERKLATHPCAFSRSSWGVLSATSGCLGRSTRTLAENSHRAARHTLPLHSSSRDTAGLQG